MIKKRVVAAAPKTVVKDVKATVASPAGRIEKTVGEVEVEAPHGFIRIGRSFTVKVEDDFVKVSADVSLPASPDEIEDGSAREKLSELLTGILNSEAEVAMGQYSTLREGGEDPEVEAEEGEEVEEATPPKVNKKPAGRRAPDPEPEPEEEAEEPAEGAEEGAITADDIRGMKRSEVLALVTEYEIGGIDADDFPNTKTGNDGLREAVIAAAGLEDEDDEEAEPEAEAEAEEGEGEEITEEGIRAMKRPALIKFIADNELEIDEKKFAKLEKLADAVVAAMSSEEEEEAEPEPEAEEGEGEGYSQEELEAYSTDDLKAIFADPSWSLGKFPPGPPKVAKKLAISKILKAQNEG